LALASKQGLETQTNLVEVLAGFFAQVYDNFPIVAFAFAGLQVLYGVAAAAPDTFTNVPASTRTAIDSAEILFDTLTPNKLMNRPPHGAARIWRFYLSHRYLLGGI
jgi:hypothetical protein